MNKSLEDLEKEKLQAEIIEISLRNKNFWVKHLAAFLGGIAVVVAILPPFWDSFKKEKSRELENAIRETYLLKREIQQAKINLDNLNSIKEKLEERIIFFEKSNSVLIEAIQRLDYDISTEKINRAWWDGLKIGDIGGESKRKENLGKIDLVDRAYGMRVIIYYQEAEKESLDLLLQIIENGMSGNRKKFIGQSGNRVIKFDPKLVKSVHWLTEKFQILDDFKQIGDCLGCENIIISFW